MAELYLISFVFILIAGVLSHDRSVTNPPAEWINVWHNKAHDGYTYSQCDDFR